MRQLTSNGPWLAVPWLLIVAITFWAPVGYVPRSMWLSMLSSWASMAFGVAAEPSQVRILSMSRSLLTCASEPSKYSQEM